nr:IS110 family transposase [Sphingobacterium mizutaii]
MAVRGLPFILDRGCGLDVHKDTVVATIKGSDFDTETKTFLTFMDDLYNLVEWLQVHSITQGRKESTGVYLRPVYAVLEDYFQSYWSMPGMSKMFRERRPTRRIANVSPNCFFRVY